LLVQDEAPLFDGKIIEVAAGLQRFDQSPLLLSSWYDGVHEAESPICSTRHTPSGPGAKVKVRELAPSTMSGDDTRALSYSTQTMSCVGS
jgi:hypothetical protein